VVTSADDRRDEDGFIVTRVAGKRCVAVVIEEVETAEWIYE